MSEFPGVAESPIAAESPGAAEATGAAELMAGSPGAVMNVRQWTVVSKYRLLLPKDLNVTGEPLQFRGRCWRSARGVPGFLGPSPAGSFRVR